MTHPDREQAVSRAFVALADTLVDDYDVIDLLDRLVAHSVSLLAAEAGGIVLADGRRRLRVVAASSEDAELMDLLQLQNDEGPSLDCYRSSAPVDVPDLHLIGRRWPAFAAAVHDKPYRSLHAIPLRLRGEAIGALNLLHPEPGPLPTADLDLAQAFADVATIGILQQRAIQRGEILAEQLQSALSSRVVIEQAKGVIAQVLSVDMDAAFDLMRNHTRHANLRLADVARRITTGELDARGLVLPAPHTTRRRT